MYKHASVDEKYNVSAEVFFNEGSGSSLSVFGSDRKYWTQRMKTALDLIGVAGFPFQLSPQKTSLLAEVSHDEAKRDERRETSAGFRRVSYHACAHVSWTTSHIFVTCDTILRTGLNLSGSGC